MTLTSVRVALRGAPKLTVNAFGPAVILRCVALPGFCGPGAT